MAGLSLLAFAALAPAKEIPVSPPSDVGLSATKLTEIDRFMEQAVASQKMAGGIVMIARKGRIGFFRCYGQRNREANQAMTPDTIFRIFSMSKAITSASALTLVESGKIDLDDPVAKYIPSFKNLKVAAADGLRTPQRPMTVRDLMLHTSGFSYGSGPEALKTTYERVKPFGAANLEEMCDRLAQVPIAFDPGTDWLYGVSTDVLGRVIEVASGETLDVFLRKTIFEPLDMRDTGFSVPPNKLSRFAANYSRSTNGLVVIDKPATSKFAGKVTLFSGGGGLLSTARDYMRFLLMIAHGGKLDGKRILKESMVPSMRVNLLLPAAFPIHFDKEIRRGTGFGLGFSVRTEITDWNPSGHVGEYGWGGAASTHYWLSPKDDLVVLTLEQIMPYQWDTEFGLKKIIYDAIQK